QSEKIAFDLDELLTCPKCGKQNPPNRSSCLYCTARLEMPARYETAVRLNLRPLEGWENGFNIVYVPPAAKPDRAAIARYLKYEPELLGEMLDAGSPFPLARIESGADADLAVKNLKVLGLKAKVVKDVDLKIGKPNIRLRSIEFGDESVALTSFNTAEVTRFGSDSIALIVTGRIVESKAESVEKRKKKERKVLDESSTSSDEMLIDLYTKESIQGWRLAARGFDFSGLGKSKKLLAKDNLETLLKMLRSFASSAVFIDEYAARMNTLTSVWDIERRTDFEGLKRSGVGKMGFGNVVRTSNLTQFTKYSRLQRLML
ncbi:MAG TPA: zinc ribbon domain-containing protein, partial [Pyrinomonadaceae bacterium]|nr:zinc ribbon domain-containing protein [Pyrinomonadaceae bacterium]